LRKLELNFSQIGIITILLFISALCFAGCTDSAPPASTVTSPPITATKIKTTGTIEVTSILQTVTTVPVTATANQVKVFGPDYYRAEYRNNITQTLSPNPRYQWELNEKIERSIGNYKGIPAIHDKITETTDYPEWVGDKLTTTANGLITVTDRYFDTSTNRFLGETTTETIKGVSKPATEIPAGTPFHREARPSWEMGITPFGEMNITLTYKGTESVTVPAGTYPAARKYTGNFRDGTPITFWVASGIPVPVQYQFPNKYLDGENPFQSYELKGWG